MASNDSNDFWGKGTPSNQPPSPDDSNEGFWSKAPKKDAPKAEPPKAQPAAASSGESGGEGFWGKGKEKGPLSSMMSKPAEEKPVEPTPADFWNKAEEKKKVAAVQASIPEDEKKLAKKRKRRKIILISLASLFLLVLILVAFAPTIAGSFAPGIIKSQAAKQISGKVSVESASFSWFGPQRVQAIKLSDKDGKDIAKLSVESSVGLTGLIFGKLDMGTITLSSVKADLVRYADGSTNIQKAIEPPPAPKGAKPAPAKAPAPAGPAETKIPDSLAAHLTAKNMQISFTDLSHLPPPGVDTFQGPPTVTLKGADLDVKVGVGTPISLVFSSDAISGAQTGKIAANIKAEKLIRKDGLVQADKASVDADISIKSIPLQMVDAFVPLGGGASLKKGLGDTIDITLKASGNLQEAKATLAAAATNLSANADLHVANSVLTTQSPIELIIKGAAVQALVPAIDQSLAQAKDTATVGALPDAHLTIKDLKFPIPVGGSDMDLRGAAASVTLALSEVVGTLNLPDPATSKAAFKPFRIAPLEVHVDSADLSKDARITAVTNATINGQPAGNINVDLSLAGLLDAKGAPVKGLPGSVSGTLAVRQIATAIAQPFVEAMKINLPADVGATLDIEARASSDTKSAAAGQTPPTDISITVQSQSVKVAGAMKLTQTGIATSGDGLRIEVATLGQMAERMVGPETGWRVSPLTAGATPGGGAVITLKNLNVPRDAAGAMQLDKAAATVSVVLGALSVKPLATPNATPIEVKAVTLVAQLLTGGNAKVDINSAMAYSGANFGALGGFDIPGLIAAAKAGSPAAMAPPEQLRPVGKLELKDVPTALARAVLPPPAAAPPAPPAKPSEKPLPPAAPAPILDLAKLLSDTLGPSMTVALNTAPVQGSPDAINAAITLVSATTNVEVRADVGKTQIALKKFSAQANVTPQTVTGLTAAFAPNVAGVPHLAGPSKIVVSADPITVPLKDFKPQLDRTGQASIKLTLPGRTVVDGLVVTNADGTKRDLGRVGVESFELAAKVSVAALFGPVLPEDRKATVTLSGNVLGNDNGPLMELSGQVAADVNNGGLSSLNLSAKLAKINTRSIEELTGQQGVLTGAVGDTASVELTARLSNPPNAAPGGAPGPAVDFAKATIDAELTLTAPHLHTDGPLKASLTPTAIQLTNSAKLSLDMDPAFVNKLLEPPPDPKQGSGPRPVAAVRVTDPATLSVTLTKFTFPRPGAAQPATLEADVGVSIPSLKMVSSDNQAIKLSQIGVMVKATPVKSAGGSPTEAPVPITFRFDVAEASIGDQPSVKTLMLSGSITDLIDARAQVNTKFAVVNMTGDLPVVPTALVDAMAKQNGALMEALGPTVALTINIERYPLGDMKPGGTPPVIEAHATAPRATAELRGTIRDNIFVSETPVRVTVFELTQAFAARFVKGLPVIGSIEKTKKDSPGTVQGSNLTVPLGDDMTKLNGDVAIDPGEARFGTSGAFASILKAIKQKESGTLGHKLEPLNVTIRSGVATYTTWRVPLGDFTIETEGTIDLVKRQIDVITWLPFGALTDQAAGSFNTGLGTLLGKAVPSVIDSATMVPFRTKGSLDNPSTKPDLELFGKNVVKQLSPEKLIKQGLGDLLKNPLKSGGK